MHGTFAGTMSQREREHLRGDERTPADFSFVLVQTLTLTWCQGNEASSAGMAPFQMRLLFGSDSLRGETARQAGSNSLHRLATWHITVCFFFFAFIRMMPVSKLDTPNKRQNRRRESLGGKRRRKKRIFAINSTVQDRYSLQSCTQKKMLHATITLIFFKKKKKQYFPLTLSCFVLANERPPLDIWHTMKATFELVHVVLLELKARQDEWSTR